MRNEIDLGKVDPARVPQVPQVPQVPAATPAIQRVDDARPVDAARSGGPSAPRPQTAAAPARPVPPGRAGGREQVSGRAWRALAVASLGTVLVGFNSTATNIALPSILEGFPGATAPEVAWGVAGYLIGLAAFLPLAGRLADRVGRKRMFQLGLALFALSAVLSAIAPTVWTLNGARVLQAIAGAAILPSSLSLVLPLFPQSRRTSAVGMWSAAGPLAAAVAPQVSSLLLSVAGWRVLYFVSAPVAALMFVLGVRILRELPTPPAQQRLDVAGAAAATIALAAIVAAVMQGRLWGYTSPITASVAVLGAVALAFFVVNSLRHPEPLLNLHLLRRRGVWVTNLSNFVVGIASQSLWLLWPLFLIGVWDYSTAGIGLALTPGPITAGISTVLFTRLGERWRAIWLCRIGAILLVVSIGWMVVRLGTNVNYWFDMAPSIALFGIGWGMCVPLLNSVALESVEESYFGEINGLFNTLRYAASAIGIAGLFALLKETDGEGVLVYYQHALVLFLVTAIAGVVTLWIPIGHRRRRS